MYIGQAKVKLFHDSSCMKELKKDISGKYFIDARVISGQPTHTLTKRIYAKNLGTHKAYNVNLVGSNQNISIQKETLRSNEKCYIDISAEIPKGDKGIRTFLIKLEYTQLP